MLYHPGKNIWGQADVTFFVVFLMYICVCVCVFVFVFCRPVYGMRRSYEDNWIRNFLPFLNPYCLYNVKRSDSACATFWIGLINLSPFHVIYSSCFNFRFPKSYLHFLNKHVSHKHSTHFNHPVGVFTYLIPVITFDKQNLSCFVTCIMLASNFIPALALLMIHWSCVSQNM